MKFTKLEEQYLEALWHKIYEEIDEETEGQPEQSLDYLEAKLELVQHKELIKAIKTSTSLNLLRSTYYAQGATKVMKSYEGHEELRRTGCKKD